MTSLTPLFNFLSPGKTNGRLSVLIFHRILEKPDPLFPGEPDAESFDKILTWMKSWFNVIPLTEAVTRLKQKSLPARAAAITFDDGYADNYKIALPLLQKHGLTATIFVSTSFINGGIMWNDAIIETVRNSNHNLLDLHSLGLGQHDISTYRARSLTIHHLISQIKYIETHKRNELINILVDKSGAELPTDLMLTTEQLLKLRKAEIIIGAHTESHPILARIEPDLARKEIVGSKNHLQAILGERVNAFAYPNGKPKIDYLTEHVDMVRNAGYSFAMSTSWGNATADCDLFQIPRFTPWDRSKIKFGLRMAQNLLK